MSMTARLPSEVEALIRAEQARSNGLFVRVPDLGEYLLRLASHAEVLAVHAAGGCHGLVAYYANDLTTRRAFITLVVVAPEWRGQGLARTLVRGVLNICRARGYTRCGLEAWHDNPPARELYERLGFVVVEDRGDRALMEIAL